MQKSVAVAPSVDLALSLAREGFHVFPTKGKKPAIKGWQAAATHDEAKARDLWADHPEWGVGIFTERFRDGALVAVDIDVKDGANGNETLVALELQGYELPPTRRHNSPRGGHHLLFHTPKPVRQGVNVLGPKVDIRSKGGYVVAYPGDGAPIAEAPQWLLERCGAPHKPTAPGSAAPVAINAERAIARATEYLTKHAPIEDDPDAYKVACKVRDFGVDEATALQLMQDLWDPRCEPPRSDNTVDPVRNAYRYAQEAIASAAPEADFEPIADVAPVEARKRRYTPIKYDAIKSMPPARWLADKLIPENALAVVYGPPKTAKTFYALDLSLSIAAGRPFHGVDVRQGRVTYCTGENAPARIGERVEAWLIENEVDPSAIADWELLSARVLLDDARAIKDFQTDIDGSRALIVFDTLARSMSGDENSQQDMSAAVAGCDAVRAATGAAVLLVHHEGKDKSRGLRGSTVLRGAIDTGIGMKFEGGIVTAYIADQRDGELGPTMSFELSPVLLDGIGRSSAALVRTRGYAGAPLKPGGQDAIALAVLQELIAEEGEPAPQALGLPDGAKVVRIAKWREKWGQNLNVPSSPDARKKAFERARKKLAKGHIEELQDFVWLQSFSA